MSIYSLILELVGKDRGATQALKSVKKEIGGLESACQKLQGGLMAAAGLAGMAYMGRQALDLVGDLYMLGAQAIRTENAFDELAKGAGGSADAILRAIKSASGGTVSEMDAMAAANRGILLGLGANADQWEKLTQVAAYRARAMGLSITQALDDITTGIGRESRMILDNLGIVLDMDAVMKQYADTLGKTVGELDAFERKQAIVNSIIEDTQDKARDAGVDLANMAKDAMTPVEEFAATWADLKVEIGKAIAEFEPLRQTIEGFIAILQGRWGEAFAEQLKEDAKAGKGLNAEVLNLLRGTGLLDEAFQQLNLEAVQQADLSRRQAGELMRLQAQTEETSTAFNHMRGVMAGLTSAAGPLEQSWVDMTQTLRELRGEMDAVMADMGALSAQEFGGAFRSDIARLDTALLGISDIAPASQIRQLREDYQAELRSFYDGVAWQIAQGTDVSEFEIALQVQAIYDSYQDAIDAIEHSGDAMERALKDQQAAWDNLKSTVEAALQPTQVTALDMYQTEMGKYVDKWDEDARRLDAIAARGFAELEAHPDWAEALAIPPEILGANEEVLKEWARQQSDLARNLMLPMDKDQIAAAVDQVHQYILQEAQRKKNIEAVALAYQAEYGGTEEQARAALGDTEAIGGIAADDVIAGFTDALTAASPAAQFQSYFKDDIEDETKNLYTRGVELWQKIESGLLDEMSQGNYVEEFARILAPYVEKEIGNRVQYVGGTPKPI